MAADATALDCRQDFCLVANKAANRIPCSPPCFTILLFTPAFEVYTKLGIHPLRKRLRRP